MGNIRHPRRGSMQFWPRKRSRHTLVRVRSWVKEAKVKPLGFIAYKAGMTHVQFTDMRAKSPTKGETINIPVTILECPPVVVAGVAVYKHDVYGLVKQTSIFAPKLDKMLDRRVQLPKKEASLDSVKDFDDLRLLVQTLPAKVASVGAKKPKLFEVGIGGAKNDKLEYARKMLGKEIMVSDVFDAGNQVDIHGVSKGKGFQGTVKRYGVPIRQHKAEKVKRGIASLGSWTPKRVEFSVAQSGKMGFHLRTEYNKKIVRVGQNPADVNRTGGIQGYGLVHNHYVLIHGSVVGADKREVVLTAPLRSSKYISKDVPELTYISK